MVERSPWLTAACHVVLIVGGLLVCVPLYYAFVAGSLTMEEAQQVPLPLVPGGRFLENIGTVWTKANFGQLLINSFVVAIGITIGKIAVSVLSACAIT